jgi:hypothetical protein
MVAIAAETRPTPIRTYVCMAAHAHIADELVISMFGSGLGDREIARRTEVPQGTVSRTRVSVARLCG